MPIRVSRRRSRSRRDAAAHVEPVLPPAAGRARGAAVEPVRSAARLLLQQRHGSGRSLPQVRAPLLARAGAPAPRVRRLRALVPRPDDGIAVGDVGRSLSRAVRAAHAGRHVRAGGRSGRARRRGHGPHRGGHRRADPGRRRRAAAHRVDGGGRQRRVPPHRRAAHRRRSAVRARSHRTGVLLARARPAAGSDGARQGARRGRADCGDALQRPRRGVRGLGDHGSTYGGNLLACRAALVFLEELVDAG